MSESSDPIGALTAITPIRSTRTGKLPGSCLSQPATAAPSSAATAKEFHSSPSLSLGGSSHSRVKVSSLPCSPTKAARFEPSHPLVELAATTTELATTFSTTVATKVYDPYHASHVRSVATSLLDTNEDDDGDDNVSCATVHSYASVANDDYLEMEAADENEQQQQHQQNQQHSSLPQALEEPCSLPPPPPPLLLLSSLEQPIQTKSGLLLTHRRTPAELLRASSSYRNRNSGTTNDDDHPAAATTTKTALSTKEEDNDDDDHHLHSNHHHHHHHKNSTTSAWRRRTTPQYVHSRLEIDLPHPFLPTGSGAGGTEASFLPYAQTVLSYVRVWVWLSAVVLLIGTLVVLHHVKHEGRRHSSTTMKNDYNNYHHHHPPYDAIHGGNAVQELGTIRIVAMDENMERQTQPETILLLPLEESNNHGSGPPPHQHHHQHQQHVQVHQTAHNNRHAGRFHRLLDDLRNDFEVWTHQHKKQYASAEEKEKRFSIWVDNHHRIQEKNERHGPCQLTQQPVFGSNHFQDLTTEEFQSQYLNARHRKARKLRPTSVPVMGPHVRTKRHPEVHRRMAQFWNFSQYHHPTTTTTISNWSMPTWNMSKFNFWDRSGNVSNFWTVNENSRFGKDTSYSSGGRGGGSNVFSGKCKWYDMSCFLQYVFETYLYGLGTTMEPAYDADSYPMGKSKVCW